MDIRSLVKELIISAYDVGLYAGRNERESEKYREALKHRTDLKNKIDHQQDSPRVEIVLTIDVESYLFHYREQDGDPDNLTKQLKRDVLRGLSEVRFDMLAQEIILRQEASNLGVSVPIRDLYSIEEDTSEEKECEG